MTMLIKVASTSIALVVTAIYLFVLYALTWANCFGESPICTAGWMPRTISTAVYLPVIAILIGATRRILQVADRRCTHPDGCDR